MNELEQCWSVIAARHRKRRVVNSVKWLGPNEAAKRRLFDEAVLLSSSSLPSGKVLVEASTNGVVTCASTQPLLGFHVLLSNVGRTSQQGFEVDVAACLEPGTVIFNVQHIPARFELLNYLNALLEVARVVDGSGPKATQPLPNHFVLAIHDWPADATKREEAEVRDWLWKFEPTYDEFTGRADEDATQRNGLRTQLEGAFLSREIVFLCDAGAPYFRDRARMLLRSRAVSGCIEGWASTPDAESSFSISNEVRLSRISRVVASLPESPVVDSSWKSGWAASRVRREIEEEFVQHCECRISRITADQVRELHATVLRRCIALSSTFHAPSQETALEDALQRFLVRIQDRDSELAVQSRTAAATSSHQPVLLSSDRQKRTAWQQYEVAVEYYVPRSYRFWFTPQGLMVVFLFFSLMAATWWMKS